MQERCSLNAVRAQIRRPDSRGIWAGKLGGAVQICRHNRAVELSLIDGVADADTASAEAASRSRGAVPESDPVVSIPRVRTYRAEGADAVTGIRLSSG